MTIDDVKKGEIFTIEETPSYPKLRLEEGYVDMRDEIVNKTGDTVKGMNVRLMTVKEISEKFEETEDTIKDWVSQLKSKYTKKATEREEK